MRNLIIAASSLVVLASQPAKSEDLRGVWFVGGAVSESSSAYGGVVYSLPGSRLGDGLAIRATLNSGKYEYEAVGSTINGEYVGGEIALMLQESGNWGWANLSLGPRLADIRLKPDDLSNHRRGTRFDVGIQTDGAIDLGMYRSHWYGSLGPLDETYHARIQFGRKLRNLRYELGIDGSILGDPSFTEKSVGGYMLAPLKKDLTVQVGTGLIWDDEGEKHHYLSVGLSSVF